MAAESCERVATTGVRRLVATDRPTVDHTTQQAGATNRGMNGVDDTATSVETEGYLAPETVAAARDRYAETVPTAKTATSEAAKAMGFDRAEYDRRVTSDVVASVRDAVFASSLRVRVADGETFDEWRAETDAEVVLVGNESAPQVVWHAPGFADQAVAATFGDERLSAERRDGGLAFVAATFGDEREAAVATLRRQAFGRLYRELFDEDADHEESNGDGGLRADEELGADDERDTGVDGDGTGDADVS